ncbi:MAG: fumarate hydratase [Nitrososphaeria archaeon]|nr:fumarate hydratase [Nitrososphaeria archaeon]NIQ33692.1 fumarate hydratase [Nitrososphaeria archaeon]
MSITEETIRKTAFKLIRAASTILPQDIVEALHRVHQGESNPVGRAHLESILHNIEIAKERCCPVCQDTGLPLFFVTVGLRSGLKCDIEETIARSVEEATKKVPLRENVINPLTKKNSGTNTGWGVPIIYYDIDNVDYVELTAVPKGFGSEVKSSLVYIPTSRSIDEGVKRCVLDHVIADAGEACPPYIIGVGLGGTGDVALHLAKKALFRSPVGSPNNDSLVAELESKLLDLTNRTNVGPMGSGGDNTALAVHIEMCGTHTAVVPVGITFQCWAARYSKARIHSNGSVEYVTHPFLSEGE